MGLTREKLGVIAVASLDVANGWVERIAHQTLQAFRHARQSSEPVELKVTEPLDRMFAQSVAGRYSDGMDIARLTESAGRLILKEGTFDKEVRRLGDRYWIDDVQTFGPELVFGEGDFQLGDRLWTRVEDPVPDEPPARWRGLIGEYGWDHNTLFIYEDEGRLWTLIEWVFRYPLNEQSEDVFSFPGYGLYHDEQIAFTRDADGFATRAVAAGVSFERRTGTSEGETFRIRPLLPVERLRAIAQAAEPPDEPRDFLPVDLVELTELDPTIKLDIRYATTNNFMGSSFYTEPRAFMQRPAAEAVIAAHQRLKPLGYGLLIHDAYRPWYVTKMFWEATPQEMKRFVADPDLGSRHNRGCAVDLTLFDLATGEPISMVSGYDEFSERAFPDYPGGTSRQRWHRQLLRQTMESVGFEVYEYEWWHFDFGRWRDYPILNVPFDDIRGQ
jgi:D-alanyl-D-alanine dipeptidase